MLKLLGLYERAADRTGSQRNSFISSVANFFNLSRQSIPKEVQILFCDAILRNLHLLDEEMHLAFSRRTVAEHDDGPTSLLTDGLGLSDGPFGSTCESGQSRENSETDLADLLFERFESCRDLDGLPFSGRGWLEALMDWFAPTLEDEMERRINLLGGNAALLAVMMERVLREVEAHAQYLPQALQTFWKLQDSVQKNHLPLDKAVASLAEEDNAGAVALLLEWRDWSHYARWRLFFQPDDTSDLQEICCRSAVSYETFSLVLKLFENRAPMPEARLKATLESYWQRIGDFDTPHQGFEGPA